ncbi:MAG: hypothetical protein AAF990_23605, partial [Bacteroidota bacterium]
MLAAPSSYAQHPGWWHLTDRDGLPGRTIYTGLQGQDGKIWLGTNNGLCSFDGRTFKSYQTNKIANQEILLLKEDSYGRIWFLNLNRKLYYLEKDSIHQLQFQEIPDDNEIYHIWMAGDHMYLSYGIRNRMNHMLKLSLKPEDRFSVSLNFEFFEGFPLARTGP